MELKTKLETTTKDHQASIQNLEAKFDRLADKQSTRPSGSLPSNTHPNPRDEETTPQPQTLKPIKETPTPKPYKPKIPYPQHLRKEKMEAHYGKFLDMIRAAQINIPLVDVLAGMPNYGKFLKELFHPFGDPESFLIPCTFVKTFSCNSSVNLGASINLMPIDVIDEILEEDFDALLDKVVKSSTPSRELFSKIKSLPNLMNSWL
ncbi:hypothetical protein Tco_0898278 [Tanacetum coccineum]